MYVRIYCFVVFFNYMRGFRRVFCVLFSTGNFLFILTLSSSLKIFQHIGGLEAPKEEQGTPPLFGRGVNIPTRPQSLLRIFDDSRLIEIDSRVFSAVQTHRLTFQTSTFMKNGLTDLPDYSLY